MVFFSDGRIKALVVGNSHGRDTFNALYLNETLSKSFDFLWTGMLQLSCFDEKFAQPSDYLDFYNSHDYKMSDMIIVSTKYGRKRRCGEQEGKTSDVTGLKFLVTRSLSSGKTVVVLGNTAEFANHEGELVGDFLRKEMPDLIPNSDDATRKNSTKPIVATCKWIR